MTIKPALKLILKRKISKKRCQSGIVKYNNKERICSGGGWHIDDRKIQLKAMIYLNDVNSKNGPFTIIKNTPSGLDLPNTIGDKSKTRFDNKIIMESEKIKKREVILLCNDLPIVFAQTIIPTETIENGFSELGNLGTKPLGDILFEKDVFVRNSIVFASFTNDSNTYWGKKTKYSVKGYRFSVMEIFLINEND